LELHFPRFLAGELSMHEQRRARMVDLFRPAKLNLSAVEADAAFVVFEKTYRDSWRAFPDAASCLKALAGYKLAVLTNGDLDQQKAKLQAAGLGSHFRNVFVSSDIGYAKPNRSAFLVSCARLGVEPNRCAYVGDSPDTDVGGSADAGLRSIWLNRDGSRNVPVEVGFPVIRSLDELADLVAG
jgi:putative hydrolase of the HAD superfamily